MTLQTVKAKLVYDKKEKKGLKNQANAELIAEFDSFMQTNDNSESYRKNNLKAIINYAEWLQAKFPRMTFPEVHDKEKHILPFLDSKRKSKMVDPDEKWITTYNDYLARTKFFFRWLYNVRLNKKGKDAINIEDWKTPRFVQIKKSLVLGGSKYSQHSEEAIAKGSVQGLNVEHSGPGKTCLQTIGAQQVSALPSMRMGILHMLRKPSAIIRYAEVDPHRRVMLNHLSLLYILCFSVDL